MALIGQTMAIVGALFIAIAIILKLMLADTKDKLDNKIFLGMLILGAYLFGIGIGWNHSNDGKLGLGLLAIIGIGMFTKPKDVTSKEGIIWIILELFILFHLFILNAFGYFQ